jgi:hypothetical protein
MRRAAGATQRKRMRDRFQPFRPMQTDVRDHFRRPICVATLEMPLQTSEYSLHTYCYFNWTGKLAIYLQQATSQ